MVNVTNVPNLLALVEMNVEDTVLLAKLQVEILSENKMVNAKTVPIIIESQLIENNVLQFNAKQMKFFQLMDSVLHA
jgi:hypothetical protein